MAMEVHGHDAKGTYFAADDSGNGATVGAGSLGSDGTDNSGSQSLTAQEALELAMVNQAKADKSKVHADRKITAQGQEAARYRQSIEAKDAEIAQLRAAAQNPQSADDMFADSNPETQHWAEQRRFNEEVAQRMAVLTQSAQHLLSGQVAARQDTEISDSHLTKVRDIYGTSLEPKVEAFLVEARKSGDPDTIIKADKVVREALLSGSAATTQTAVASQAGVGGASGVSSGGVGAGQPAPTPSGELTEETRAEIVRVNRNDRQGQYAAEMMAKLNLMESAG
jgi:hypothetical protein